jgi:polygalacturonase
MTGKTRHVLRLSIVAIILTSLGCRATERTQTFDVTAHGAVGDGTTNNSEAFRRSIDACRAANGGVVRIPTGRFLTGPIDMVSNMTLHLDEGAVLLFTDDPDDYPLVETRWEGTMRQARRPLLWARDCRNIKITGSGVIDGQGQRWWRPLQAGRLQRPRNPTTAPASRPWDDDGSRRRPPLVQLRDCDGILVDGVTFQNSPFWTMHLLFSDNIIVRRAKFFAPEDGPNTDAMDIDSCRRVLVEDCYADVGDDAFTLKSGRDADGRRVGRPTEDVTVRRCVVKHAHGGVTIGSEMSGDIRRVRFYDCDFEGTDTGFRMKTMRGRGGVVEDVRAENIRMKNVINAIWITMRYQRTDPAPYSEETTPIFRDIHLNNITATGSRRAGIIDGLEEMSIQDVTFGNMDIAAQQGFTCSYGSGIEFSNVNISVDYGPALSATHTPDLRLDRWRETTRLPTSQPATRPFPATRPRARP